MNDNRQNGISPARDTEKAKKRIKKAMIVIAAVLAGLAVAALAAQLVGYLADRDRNTPGVRDGIEFFPAYYSENIFEDEAYLALNRSVYFSSYGEEFVLDDETAAYKGPAAKMFLKYFDCVINGDYGLYPSFFAEEYRNSEDVDFPSKFTMQKIYDIGVKLFSVIERGENGELTEVYEVRYRIFENNGTFRRDIGSMETRTLVFEVYTDSEGNVLINGIGYRSDK